MVWNLGCAGTHGIVGCDSGKRGGTQIVRVVRSRSFVERVVKSGWRVYWVGRVGEWKEKKLRGWGELVPCMGLNSSQ